MNDARTEYEFYDFGCSHGQSIRQAMALFGAERGLGMDISPEKVAQARSAGFEAEVRDILALDERKQVRFTTMVHFLEHLDGFGHATQFIRKACSVSSEFVFIRQPFFDADGPLAQLGLKCYWSDWSGHRFCMSTLELYRVLRQLCRERRITAFRLGWYRRVADSSDAVIIPLDAPHDQHHYDSATHGAKPVLPFTFPVYQELRALVDTGGAQRPVLDKQVYLGEPFGSGWTS